jgi:hypothetical protein
MRNSYKILVGKPEEKMPLGRLRHRWEVNIKMDLKYIVTMWTGFFWLRIGSSDWL